MNLVSYEYVACQRGRDGVLVIGKDIGAATMLQGAVLVDPRDCEEVVEGLEEALGMCAQERSERQEKSLRTVETHTSEAWGKEFVRCLREV